MADLRAIANSTDVNYTDLNLQAIEMTFTQYHPDLDLFISNEVVIIHLLTSV